MVTATTEAPKNQPTPESKIPYIHEDQIFDYSYDPEDKYDSFGADVDEPYIWGVTGVRGAGKSLTLCYYGVRALAMGLTVFSNFPIKYKLLRHGKEPKLLESTPLLFKDLLTLDDSYKGSLVEVDEYQDWANALSFNTIQNRLLNSVWAQIRKLDMSFMYGAKKLRWIDLRTREETDIEIRCKDAFRDPQHRRELSKGEKIYQDYIDWSGNWTGKDYEDFPMTYPTTFQGSPFWNAYNTKERFDIFEAMRGFKLDLTKNVISDKEDDTPQINMEQMEGMITGLFKKDNRWRATELFDTLGVPHNMRARIGVLMKDMGVRDTMSGGVRHFTFNPDTELEPDIASRVGEGG